MKQLCTTIAFLAAMIPVSAQDTQQQHLHSIDSAYHECLSVEANQSTHGMINCASMAYDAWDAELNRVYKQLMSVLSAEEKEKLKAAQKSWIAWRNSELAFSDLMHDNLGGSMWRVVAAERALTIVRQRVLELQAYCDTVRDGK